MTRNDHMTSRFGSCVIALLLGASLAVSAPANASKVGVAAAVNPDAFSSLSGVPNKQLNIGKSIFYNERIETSAQGLVQVLLVDGSTFTVGPNSNLTIDRFVYDPKKKTGEMVATFSKGSMRFIGGKLSKNAGGVKVNTPSGSLAIRGGMFQGNTQKKIYSFLYGHSLTFTGRNGQTRTLFQPGYTLDLLRGGGTVRPTTAEDTNFFMQALSSPATNSASNTGTNQSNGANNTFVQLADIDASEIINEAATTNITGEILEQLKNSLPTSQGETTPTGQGETTPTTQGATTPTSSTSTGSTPTGSTPAPGGQSPPPPTENPNLNIMHGYAGGVYTVTSDDAQDAPAGTLTSFAPDDFKLVFDKETKAFEGASMALFRDLVDPNPKNPLNEGGGATFLFSAVQTLYSDDVQKSELSPSSSSVFAGVADTDAISVYDKTVSENNRPKLDVASVVNSGNGALVGFTGAGGALCNDCDFITWGAWGTGDPLNFTSGDDSSSIADAFGLWIAGDVVQDVAGALPTTGSAFYDGTAIGEVWNTLDKHQGPERYFATGDMLMDWDFASRSGEFNVTNFDSQKTGGYIPSGINFGGTLKAPGIPTGNLNQFGGTLVVTSAPSGRAELNGIGGYANGSFVGATHLPGNIAGKPKGVIGNWNIGSTNYKAGGIFGGSLRPQ
jgi:hypothetical protein